MRKIYFENEKYYHIFNCGVDKRSIFLNHEDLKRFLKSMIEFNVLDPIGSIYEVQERRKKFERKFGNSVSKEIFTDSTSKIIEFICYCLNPNHFHFLVQQIKERGIEKFMHRLGVGYTKYFNEKYKRNGSLQQGPFKAVPVDSNEYLLYLSVYINLNNKAHGIDNEFYKSSWKEYLGDAKEFCKKEIIIDQFKDISKYKEFAEESLKYIKERKELGKLLLE